MSEVKLEGVTTDVTTLREQVMSALRAFAERNQARERLAVDTLANVLAHLDATSSAGREKRTPAKVKKKRGAE
ncbi:MAG: hypothetical protein ACRELY_29345 [Polyangiaceae bacterium]